MNANGKDCSFCLLIVGQSYDILNASVSKHAMAEQGFIFCKKKRYVTTVLIQDLMINA
jgi:hypothetical protein